MSGLRYSCRVWFCGVLLVIATSSAQAIPVIEINFHASPASSTENAGVTGRLSLGFLEDGGLDLLSVLIQNTTPVELGSGLTAVGFELPPGLTSDPVFAPGGAGAYFDQLSYDVSVSPAWMKAPGGYDLMISSDGNLNGGSAPGAPAAGQSEMLLLSLGNTPYSPIELFAAFIEHYDNSSGPIAIARFQAIGDGGEYSDKVLGAVGQAVPEPSSLLLIAGSMLALRRRVR